MWVGLGVCCANPSGAAVLQAVLRDMPFLAGRSACGLTAVHIPFLCTQVMIWDDHQGKAIGELSFRSEVRTNGITLRGSARGCQLILGLGACPP
jgi:hypothetical protein